MKSSLTIPVAIVVGGLIVAAAVYISVKPEGPAGDGKVYRANIVRPVDSQDHILGNPAAKVMIIEYSDFQCQYCKAFHTTLEQVIANEGTDGDVAWVFRHFPLSEIHANAVSHARAAECAAATSGNDAFWKFAGELFKGQPVSPSQYGSLASAALITGDAFAACNANASTTLDARIQADRKNAMDMGAKGTPFSVILAPGKEPIVLDGAYPYDAVRQLLDQALAQ